MYNLNTHKEFGFILMYYLPKAYALFEKGLLSSTESRLGTEPLFYFSPNHTETDKHDGTLFSEQLNCYSFNNPRFTNEMWTPPKLKEYFKNDELLFDKPILTIHNKNSIEWQRGLFNYFDADTLDKLIDMFKTDYQIIYIKPFYENSNMTKDTLQKTVDIGDNRILDKHKEVLTIEELFNKGDYKSYNELQFKILANSEHHISPAGDCVIPAYFGGDLLIYNHPNCNSTNRGVWKTGSWLKLLSGANIYGFNDYNQLIDKSIELWK